MAEPDLELELDDRELLPHRHQEHDNDEEVIIDELTRAGTPFLDQPATGRREHEIEVIPIAQEDNEEDPVEEIDLLPISPELVAEAEAEAEAAAAREDIEANGGDGLKQRIKGVEGKVTGTKSAAPAKVLTSRKNVGWLILMGTLLTINAGWINAVFLYKQYIYAVTHETGNLSKAAIYLASGQWTQFASMLGMLFFFFLGAILAGIVIRKSSFQLRKRYGIALFLEGCLLLLAEVILVLKQTDNNFVADFCITMGMGLQNGMVTNFSAAVIRTTHVTGTLTDIGLVIGTLIRTRDPVRSDLWKLQVLVPLFSGYWLGGLFSSLLMVFFDWNLLYLLIPPIGFYLGLGVLYFSIRGYLNLASWYWRTQLRRRAQEVINSGESSIYIPERLPHANDLHTLFE